MEGIIKFLFVCFCFAVSVISYGFCISKRDWGFLSIGLMLTTASDFFIIIRENYLIGIIIFSFVHIAYIFRISSPETIHMKLKSIAITFICVIPTFFVLNRIIAAAILYVCFFAHDIAANAKNYKNAESSLPKINRTLILAGIISFAICDINVLLYNSTDYITAPKWISELAYPFIWTFYVPSQLLLSISAVKFDCE